MVRINKKPRSLFALGMSESLPRGSNVSFLLMTYVLLRGYYILPKKELHSSLWVSRT